MYCSVHSDITPDDGHRNCPKHVESYSKNKFEKLLHLVGFIIRIYHDARSPERQNVVLDLQLHIYSIEQSRISTLPIQLYLHSSNVSPRRRHRQYYFIVSEFICCRFLPFFGSRYLFAAHKYLFYSVVIVATRWTVWGRREGLSLHTYPDHHP